MEDVHLDMYEHKHVAGGHGPIFRETHTILSWEIEAVRFHGKTKDGFEVDYVRLLLIWIFQGLFHQPSLVTDDPIKL
jgi:hypothetical protein